MDDRSTQLPKLPTAVSTRDVNGVRLGIESFGNATAPLILCVGGTTMFSWPDALCEKLARGGRYVVRYDLRDAGASTTGDAESPQYTLRDLAADAVALAGNLSDRPAHLAGIGVGGFVAQVAALDHPASFSALTLIGTRPVAPGPTDPDLPDHDQATMSQLFSRPGPDWEDRASVVEYAAQGATILGNDPDPAREIAGRIWDRTPAGIAGAHPANQLGTVFARLDCKPRWRERLGEIALPTLVAHGRRDPFFPVGNGEALAREIPDARLLVLEGSSTVISETDVARVAAAMLGLQEH
ncbi:pimeloyl-ACP methyl ester carboxylesterase [Leucobacter exalbidus]|uniref:Pimeloyl-ACP methyl ester carboxylesterase n=1 Tax=Leucobacter exalbidus TaxID=662960 RepID=A0A940PWA0_9MICO|nr:alpha/beta hydrolase [Leucobacter exalbidus]MBP1325376.1 pimeloyl-ACP methyl ester carboxylesterase [Leucobacter exalbidus]